MSTYNEILLRGVKQLEGRSPSPRLDAEVLLCCAAGISRSKLLISPKEAPSLNACQCYEGFIARRAVGEPVAYITAAKEFWGLEFKVSPEVLIPRPETELLVEKGLEYASRCCGGLRILDLGTGSGCIAVALARELRRGNRRFEMFAVDKSEAALETARANAARHQVFDCVCFKQSNWFDALPGQEFHLIVSNPPYIALGDTELSPELCFEPQSALYAGEKGTEAVEFLLQAAPRHLAPEGIFLCEIGAGQRGGLSAPHGWRIFFHKDLAGIDRVLGMIADGPGCDMTKNSDAGKIQ